jgi:uncharacterized membrane protein
MFQFNGSLWKSLEFDLPQVGWPILAVLALAILAVVGAYLSGLRRHQHLRMSRRVALLLLRLGAIACLLFALLHPALLQKETQIKKAIVAVVLDDSQSMSSPLGASENAAEGKAVPTRYARAVETLQAKLKPALGQRYRLAVYDIQGQPLDIEHLPPSPTATVSPIGDTLSSVERDLAGEPLSGIVLLSDGIQNTPQPSIAGPDELHTKVYPIELASRKTALAGPPDLSIQSVAANRLALVGNTVRVKVDIATNGEAGATQVPVWITDGKDTGHPIAKTSVSLRSDDPLVRAELEFTPLKPGQFTYLVQVGHVPGEVNLKNNRQTFPLTVRAKALRVLYLDGVLRWEGKFIREALSADPDINVVFAVRTSPAGIDSGSQGLLLGETLSKLDMVILGDVEATYFSAKELEALNAWVTEKGGALMLSGGYHSFGPDGFGRTSLRQIMPVNFSNNASPQVEQPFSIQITEEGKESPIFDLTGNRIHDSAFFQKLPQLSGCSLIAGVKPGAQVLAVNPQIRNPEGKGGLPILVAQQVGAGRTMVFTVDNTWRWRMVMGGFTGDTTFYQRFWGQLVRWMTANEETTPQQLLVSTDRSRYEPQQTVRLNIDVSPAKPAANKKNEKPSPAQPAAKPAPEPAATAVAWHVSASALDEEGRQKSVELTELSPTHFQASFTPARPGRWDVTVLAEPEAKLGDKAAEAKLPTLSQVTTIEVARPDMELADVEPRPQWLTQLARSTGGHCLKPDQVAQLADELPDQPVEVFQASTVDLWRHPALAGVFFFLLCSEWILRRVLRLA